MSAPRQWIWLFWPQTTGVVLRYWIRREKPDGQPFYYAVVRFETTDGRSVTTISSTGWWRHRWRIGQRVRLRYQPANPRIIEIAADIWGCLLTALGLVAMAFIALWFWYGLATK